MHISLQQSAKIQPRSDLPKLRSALPTSPDPLPFKKTAMRTKFPSFVLEKDTLASHCWTESPSVRSALQDLRIASEETIPGHSTLFASEETKLRGCHLRSLPQLPSSRKEGTHGQNSWKSQTFVDYRSSVR